MDLIVPKIALVELGEKHEQFKDFYSRWTEDFEEVRIKRVRISKDQIKDLEVWLNENKDRNKIILKCLKRVNSFNKLFNSADVKKIKRAIDIPPALEGFLSKNLVNNMVYKESDGVLLPYLIYGSEYHKPERDNPAYTSIDICYVRHGELKKPSIRISNTDLIGEGLTILEMLNNKGYLCETEELENSWRESVGKYEDLMEEVGSVHIGSGSGNKQSGRWYSDKYYFKNDKSNKVVVDFKGYYLESNRERLKSATQFIQSNIGEQKHAEVPIHPYGHVFHLEDHCWVDVHVDNLEEYEFKGNSLLNKLILPNKDKTLINILIEMSKMKIDDIVEGKSGGSFIMATGIPGTGKTLTAEVFSESVKKPLYKVQCSQLGISVDDVEKKLSSVLKRASRWGAILLIDEADVYVRERGADINQNAIVGVFLRTLEYYSGILFMTSNMETAIDDAIMSRATAHLTYEAPSKEDQVKIWKVLNDQFNAGLTDKIISNLVYKFPNLVGRDIKALLKLSMMYARGKGIELEESTFTDIYSFIPNVLKNHKKN